MKVNQDTGEVEEPASRPPILMNTDGRPFATPAHAQEVAQRYGLDDYQVQRVPGGSVAVRPTPSIPEVPLSSVESRIRVARWLGEEATRRKATGEFLNPNEVTRAHQLIAENGSPKEVQAAIDAAFQDPVRVAIDKWNRGGQAASEAPQAKDEVPPHLRWVEANERAQKREEENSAWADKQASETVSKAQKIRDYAKAEMQRTWRDQKTASKESLAKITQVPQPTVKDIASQVKRKRKKIKKSLRQRGVGENTANKVSAVIATYNRPFNEAPDYLPNRV